MCIFPRSSRDRREGEWYLTRRCLRPLDVRRLAPTMQISVATSSKQRVARDGKGRSGGFRTIIAYWRGERAIFLHLFAKARQANIGRVELETLQKLARLYDGLADEQLDALVASRGWRKVERKDGEEEDVS